MSGSRDIAERKITRPTCRNFALPLLLAALLAPSAALAALPAPATVAQPELTRPQLCTHAAHDAARLTGVPVEILLAIALTESGRTYSGEFGPWPWTVNIAGEGRWFDTRAAAETFAREHLDSGARSFDIGCFQINYRWHGTAFDSVEHMFDPRANALYAARFLLRLQQEYGDWDVAVASYHSRTPELADRYFSRFQTHLAALDPDMVAIPAANTERYAAGAIGPASNSRSPSPFPLIKPGSPAGPGSLMPIDAIAATGPILPGAIGASE